MDRSNPNFINIPQKIRGDEAAVKKYTKDLKQHFQVVAQTESGMELIKFLAQQCRIFENSLDASKDLRSQGAPDGYLPALQDLGKTLLGFMTEVQLAKLFIETKKGV